MQEVELSELTYNMMADRRVDWMDIGGQYKLCHKDWSFSTEQIFYWQLPEWEWSSNYKNKYYRKYSDLKITLLVNGDLLFLLSDKLCGIERLLIIILQQYSV